MSDDDDEQHPEGTLAFLKTELDITASEAAEWDAFAEAYRDAKSDKMASGGMMEGGATMQSLPDRIAQHVKMMEHHLASLKSLQAPLSELYATLSSDQKHTADELVPMFVMCRMM